MLPVFASAALAASLDNTEVGGLYGDAVATNATAVWYNPAGLADERGTRFFVEVAPTFATVGFDRVDPYHGGADTYKLTGAVPFAAVASDFGVDGLGAGIGLALPFVRGGKEVVEGGPGSFAMRDGDSQAAYALLSVGYHPEKLPISLGLQGALVHNRWEAHVDNEVTTSLDASIEDQGQQSGYTDAQIEDPHYTALANFDGLTDTTFTFGAGVRVTASEKVAIALSYHHGATFENTGDAHIDFDCPPESDETGRFGAESFGLCHSSMKAHGIVRYAVPARVQGGVRFSPTDRVDVDVVGAYVFWSAYRDFDITVKDVESLNEFRGDTDQERAENAAKTAAMVNQHRLWARDTEDSFNVAIDVKGDLSEQMVLGGRLMYDHAAIPSSALSPNNWDADGLLAGALFGVEIVPGLSASLEYSHMFFAARTVTDSAYIVTLDEANRKEDRYSYPQMNGTYTGSIDRLGLSIKGSFGEGRPKIGEE